MRMIDVSNVGGNEDDDDNDDNIYQDFILCDIFWSGNDVKCILEVFGPS